MAHAKVIAASLIAYRLSSRGYYSGLALEDDGFASAASDGMDSCESMMSLGHNAAWRLSPPAITSEAFAPAVERDEACGLAMGDGVSTSSAGADTREPRTDKPSITTIAVSNKAVSA